MYSSSSRSTTPSRSPHHSRPVPIPHSPSTELPPANALRYKHLYGYTQSSVSSSFDTLSGQSSVTESSEGDYEDYVVDTQGMGIVIDERDETEISPSVAASISIGTTSTSPLVFSLSTAATAATVARVAASPDGEILIEDVEETYGSEEGRRTPTMISPPPANGLKPVRDTPSFGNIAFPLDISDNASDNSMLVGATRISRNRQRSSRTSPRGPAKSKAHDWLDDEFRCQTCFHAGLCADLVMKDPNFRCGDISVTGSTSRESSAGIGGKTPWTREMLDGMNLGSPVGADDGAGKPKLRVLDGGVDYVQYDDAEGLDVPRRDRSLVDLEDIARGMQAVSIPSSIKPQPIIGRTATPNSQHSIERPLGHNIAHQIRTDVEVEDPTSTTTTYEDSTSDSLSSPQDIFSTCADTRVRLGAVSRGREATSKAERIPTDKGDRSRSSFSRERGRSRSRNNHPFWTLHNLTAGLLSGGSLDSDRVDGRYDSDDQLYGVDVVERGRSRIR
jgi:hypothetical protein